MQCTSGHLIIQKITDYTCDTNKLSAILYICRYVFSYLLSFVHLLFGMTAIDCGPAVGQLTV